MSTHNPTNGSARTLARSRRKARSARALPTSGTLPPLPPATQHAPRSITGGGGRACLGAYIATQADQYDTDGIVHYGPLPAEAIGSATISAPADALTIRHEQGRVLMEITPKPGHGDTIINIWSGYRRGFELSQMARRAAHEIEDQLDLFGDPTDDLL